MKFVYGKNANKSGIYKILNTANGRVYIGSAASFKKRWNVHKADLEKQRHSNIFLQNDFNKCGSEAFLCEVLEVVVGEKSKRLFVEQQYIDKHYDDQKMCYNLCPTAGNRSGSKNKKPYDPKTDGRATSRTPEVRKVVSEKNKKAWRTDEKRKEASIHANKRWSKHSANVTLVNASTKEEVFVRSSLRKFAIDNNLSYKSLHLLVKGKTKTCGGWYMKYMK